MSDAAVAVGRVVVLCPLSFESAAVRLAVRGVMGRLGLSNLVVERGGRMGGRMGGRGGVSGVRGGIGVEGGMGVAGGGGGVEVLTVGPGGDAVARAVRGLGEGEGGGGEFTVLLSGVCGGLDPLLASLAVWAEEVVDERGGRFSPDVVGSWSWRDVLAVVDGDDSDAEVAVDADGDSAQGGDGFFFEGTPASSMVRILGVESVISDPAHKRVLFGRFGASVCDTESHAFASACFERSRVRPTRWGVLRGVSDGADDVLPACVSGWVDERGRTRVGRVLRDVLFRRVSVGELTSLGSRSKRALSAVNDELAMWLLQEMVLRGAVSKDRAGEVVAMCGGNASLLWCDPGGFASDHGFGDGGGGGGVGGDGGDGGGGGGGGGGGD